MMAEKALLLYIIFYINCYWIYIKHKLDTQLLLNDERNKLSYFINVILKI